MKKRERNVLLFLMLVLALSGGITYLALNQSSKIKSDEDVLKMTVALVNEDNGASFDGTEFGFGDEFIKSIESDNTHDWYVVSRGVAENGLKNNAYNMMIVIPNDFSERALSIDDEAPEKIKLNYKINASGNSEVLAEAEKTASVILGDFNRRIIDVYFASVIGNLQDAQDNITTIVEKDEIYTNTYKNAVHSPLSQYTSQFQAVQDNTQVSKESFEGLQKILNTFEDGLGEGVNTNTDNLSLFNDIAKTHETNMLSFNNFSSQFSRFDEGMQNSEVLQRLQNLELANKEIYEQFQKKENSVTKATEIQEYFDSTNKKLKSFNTDLGGTLGVELEGKVAKRLQGTFDEAFGEDSIRLKDLLKQPDNNIHETLRSQITKLPTLDPLKLDDLGLSKSSIKQLKNVITVTNKYNDEFVDPPVDPKNSVPLTKQIEDIKMHLIDTGVEVEDFVEIPKTKKWGQEFTLAIPEEYEVAAVFLKLPGKTERNYTRAYNKHKKIKLQATSGGDLGVRVLLKLKNVDSSIDVFQPVTWNWQLDQKDIEEFDLPNPKPDPEEPKGPEEPEDKEEPKEPAIPEEPEDAELENEEENKEPVNPATEDMNPESNKETGDAESDSGDLQEDAGSEDVVNPVSEENPEEPKEDGGSGEEEEEEEEVAIPSPEDPKDPTLDPVKIKDNKISHKIMSSLTEDSTGKLINASAETVSQYQKMLMLYEVYFGLDMDTENSKLISQLEGKGLGKLATENESSLYHLFNEKTIVELLKEHIVGVITGNITEQVREQVEGLQDNLSEYGKLVAEANRNSDELTNILGQTKEQAGVMNESVEGTLSDLSKWREATIGLLDEQETISTNTNEEQTALISLDGQFTSLLTNSQSLADQAKGNLQSADGVYQSFDAIDKQAKDIQKSGTTLVNQADTLATNMTDKLMEDQNFADNFAGVLENSRIGERPNENLYSFLSNPVQTKNAGVISTGDKLTPYFLVLIGFIVSLFTAYAISTNDRKRVQKDSFAGESTIINGNSPITLITASIGIVEGLVIGTVSGYLLDISQGKFFLWIGLMALIMLTMLLVATYLLRQLKMIGMFVLLIMLSLYLFSTEALGSDFDKLSLATSIRKYSPLQYVESLLTSFAQGIGSYQGIAFILIGLALLALAANFFVIQRSSKKEGVEDEGVTEAR